ncbi:MAG: LicD family protein [Candidatus Marinimicrobia bacterium]|nr:LicD family protein [Candidatus Neomarinimicrobiota bacterium]
MGTRHAFGEENAAVALTMLEKVTSIFESYEIKYCLTAGTLLGIVRENRLLPWDTDLDLRIFRNDVNKLPQAMWKIRLAGYLARTRRQEIKDSPLHEGEKRIVKIFNKAGFLKKGEIVMDCFIAVRHGDQYIWSCGGPKFYTKKAVPSHFYDNTQSITFQGKSYTAPAEVEDYLTFRYGDWRTPVKQWDYTKDDGAIISPETES